jgi:hypothetical protein
VLLQKSKTVYISPCIIWANLLDAKRNCDREDEGVSDKEVGKFIRIIKEKYIDENKLYIDLNDQEINKDLLIYSREFRSFQMIIYIAESLKLHHFNSGYDKSISEIFVKAANETISK